MDSYIFKSRRKPSIEDFYCDDYNEIPRCIQMWYGRKFWDLHNSMSFLQNYECGEYVKLRKCDVEEMLQFACHHRDYFDTFNTVPDLAEIVDEFDENEEKGIYYWYECDW